MLNIAKKFYGKTDKNIVMQDYATKNEVQEIVNKAVDDLSEIISQLAQNMHGELAELRADIIDFKESHNKLLNTFDAFLKRLDDIETDNHA